MPPGLVVVLTAAGGSTAPGGLLAGEGVVAATTVATGARTLAAVAGSDGADKTCAVVFATRAETFTAAPVGDSAAADRLDLETPRLVLRDAGADIAGVGVAAVVGLVLPTPVTNVPAPPEACTTPARGSVDDPDWIGESVAAPLNDEFDDAGAAARFADEPEDPEPAGVEPPDEEPLGEPLEEPEAPFDEEPLASASAMAGLLAIATPNPSATVNAPSRPT